jgi:hypothetical protein
MWVNMRTEQGGSLSSGNCVHLLTAFCHKLYLCVSSDLSNKQSLLLSRLLTLYASQWPRKVLAIQKKMNVYTLVKFSCFSSALRQVDRCVSSSTLLLYVPVTTTPLKFFRISHPPPFRNTNKNYAF